MSYFFYLSILVGLVQVIDAIALYKAKGLPTNVSAITTAIEFLWVVVCVFFLSKTYLDGLSFIMPLTYITYNLLGWVYAAISGVGTKTPIPNWFIIFGGLFGIYYAVGNALIVTNAL